MSTPFSVSSLPPGLQAGLKSSSSSANGGQGGDPLAFLTALLDQLGATTGTDTGNEGTPDQDALAAALTQLVANAQPTAQSADKPGDTPPATALLAQLTHALEAIEKSLQAGETPDKDKLSKLSDAVDALMALLVPPQPAQPAAALSADSDALDPLAAIAAAKTPTPTAPTPTTGDAAPAKLPALTQLADDIEQLGADLSKLSPDLADKLKALSSRLDAAISDPSLLSALDGGGDATQHDKVVAALLNGAPKSAPTADTPAIAPATPQLDASKKLDTPDSLVKSADDAGAPKTTAADASPSDSPRPHDKGDKHHSDAKSDDKPAIAAIAAHATRHGSDESVGKTDTTVSAIGPAQPAQMGPAPKLLPAAYQNAAASLNMGQVAFEIAHQMQKGQSRFTIRLDPPELGRVDVRMNVDATGAVNARLTVEKPETLDMFQRDKTTLERALAQAGLDSSKTNLEFSLRQNPFAGMAGGEQRSGGNPGQSPRFFAEDDPDAVSAAPSVTLYRGTASAGGVNLFV